MSKKTVKKSLITLSEEEFELIETAAKDISLPVASFIRIKLIAAMRDKNVYDQKALTELIYQLKKIGTNINVQTKKLHTKKQISSEDYILVLKQINDLEQIITDTLRI